jgi:type I restriction enzyme, S subunit
VSELPDGWETVSLGELGEWGSGGTPKRTNPRYYEGGMIPWLIIGDLNDGTVYSARTHITEDGLLSSSTKLLPINTLLIAMYGSIGKLGITGVECATNQAIAFCKPNTDVVSLRYLFHCLMESKNALVAQGQGGAQQNISQGILKAHPVPLAPLNEQKRIADKLDALLARVDACRERLDRVPLILKRFRQAVLAAATSGQLTEDWREENQCNFDEWQEVDVQSIAMVGTGSTPLRSNSRFFSNSGTPWITSAATGELFVTKAHEFVTEEAVLAHRLKRYPIGTLLVAMYGEGKTRGQVAELAIEATINQACAAVIVDEAQAVKEFVKLTLQANYLEMRELAEGGNQPNLNLSKIKEFKLALPSIDEQQEIIHRVKALFTLIDRLEARYKMARAQVEQLTPALLAKAFRGELVPQDPNDEPASVLLERIRAARVVAEEDGAKPQRRKLVSDNPPKTKVIMLIRKDVQPTHLSSILRTRGPLTAKDLWSASQLEIDDFYDQLRDEEANGLLRETGEDSNTPRLLEAT